jgi:hypothetical protein
MLGHSSSCLLIAHVTPLCNSCLKTEADFIDSGFHRRVYRYCLSSVQNRVCSNCVNLILTFQALMKRLLYGEIDIGGNLGRSICEYSMIYTSTLALRMFDLSYVSFFFEES